MLGLALFLVQTSFPSAGTDFAGGKGDKENRALNQNEREQGLLSRLQTDVSNKAVALYMLISCQKVLGRQRRQEMKTIPPA